MKHSFNRNLVWLRICITTFLLAIISLFLFSFTVSRKLTDDLWKQLGLSEMQGTQKIKNSFFNNYLDYYGARNIKNITTGSRAAVASDLLSFAKQYMNSPAFKAEYEKLRADAKPVEPVDRSRSKDEIRKEKIEETKKAIKTTEELLKKSDANMKEIMKPVLEMHNANLKEYQDPNSAMIDLFYQGEQFNKENNIRSYKENLKKWETDYPADYKLVIRSRLQKYLDIARTVDFSAQLVEKNGKKYFVNRTYEGKSDDWKMIFRAGKEVQNVTVAFATQWLKEL
jgi:hypothetical protein